MPTWAPITAETPNAMWFKDSGSECAPEAPGAVVKVIVDKVLDNLDK